MPSKFDIVGERHAIVEFQAILRFINPLDPGGMSEVAAAIDRNAQTMELPAKLVVPTFKFELGGGGGGPSISPPSTSFGFQRFSPDGKIEARIAADSNSISYLSREYPGWDVVRTTLTDFFGSVGQAFYKRSQLIGGVLIQYANQFSSINVGYHEVSEIFREDSPWVSGISRASPDLWHSHVGQFIPDDHCKKLVNVNVDVVLASTPDREGDFTEARVMIVAAKQFDVPGAKPLLLLPDEAPEQIAAHFDDIHALEKEVLRSTLSDQYLIKVNA